MVKIFLRIVGLLSGVQRTGIGDGLEFEKRQPEQMMIEKQK